MSSRTIALAPVDFSQFTGQKIRNVEYDLDAHQLILTFENGSLAIACAWRLRREGTILLGQQDYLLNSRLFHHLSEYLLDKPVTTLYQFALTSDLVLKVTDLSMDIFRDGAIENGWFLVGRDGFYLKSHKPSSAE